MHVIGAAQVNSGACRRVVDSRSRLPGGGSFANFEGTPSVAADGTVVFMADASNASQSGVYGADVSGGVWPVVAMGDSFTYLRARGTGWDGRCLAALWRIGSHDSRVGCVHLRSLLSLGASVLCCWCAEHRLN